MNDEPKRRIDNGSTREQIILTGVAAPDEAQVGTAIAIPCSDGRMWWPTILRRTEVITATRGWRTALTLQIALPADPMLNAEVTYPSPYPDPDSMHTAIRDVGRHVMDAYGQRVPADLIDAWTQGECNSARPYIVCPECGGLRCDLCSHRGWLRAGEAEADARNRGPGLEPLSEARARFRASHMPILSAESAQPIGWKAKRIDPRSTLRDVGRALGAAAPGLGEAVREAGRRESPMRVLSCDEFGVESLDGVPTGRVLYTLPSNERRAEVQEMLKAMGVYWTAKRDVEAGQLVTAADVEPIDATCVTFPQREDVPLDRPVTRSRMRIYVDGVDVTDPPCPSCDTARFLRRLENGQHFCACGWHGASLTPPAAAPRFAPGQWARVDDTASNLHGVTVQIVKVLSGDWFEAVRPRSDTLTRRTRKSGCGEVTSVYAGAMLVAAERPR